MNVNLSCHRACLGRKTLAQVVAMRPIVPTPARAMAEVGVNTFSKELMVVGKKGVGGKNRYGLWYPT